jgi:hypothetical protein
MRSDLYDRPISFCAGKGLIALEAGCPSMPTPC